mgnify:CR=1 FL=1
MEKGAIRDNLEVIFFAMVLILFFKTFVAQQFKIPTASMRNTLMIGGSVMIGAGIANKSPVTIKDVTPIARLTEEAGVIVVPGVVVLGDVIEVPPPAGSCPWGAIPEGMTPTPPPNHPSQ